LARPKKAYWQIPFQHPFTKLYCIFKVSSRHPFSTYGITFLCVCPIWLPVFFLFFYNEPELGAGINPGMALTPLPSSIGRG